MSTMLRFIGEFQELGYCAHGKVTSLIAVKGKRRPDHKREVVRYLRTGKMMVLSPGLDNDVFSPRELSDTPSIRTDGVFAWRELLAHYVAKYDVELPEEFEEHMRARHWSIADPIDVGRLVLPASTTSGE